MMDDSNLLPSLLVPDLFVQTFLPFLPFHLTHFLPLVIPTLGPTH